MSEDPRLAEYLLRWEELREEGNPVSVEELCQDCPDLIEPLRKKVQALLALEPLIEKSQEDFPTVDKRQSDLTIPHRKQVEISPEDSPVPDPEQPKEERQIPTTIDRYRVQKILGEGGQGLVYLAHDDELQRLVAIKVPHAHRVGTVEDFEAFWVEARILARLDHPQIVPVFDVGRTDKNLPFVVSKFIEGSNLAEKISQARLTFRESVLLLAQIADALQYAHQQGLVHRDVKPGNILLDANQKPFLADFGLALKEEDIGKGGGFVGTYAYMSPEQANGEGHLVDGRSDIFSLGVILFELLVGRRPFTGNSIRGIRRQIIAGEVRPPRQIDPAIPRELERITLKALAKRASDRYPTAVDLADDLKHWLGTACTSPAENISQSARTIIPKGLRSFDAHDADFFLELLPGPRDRHGMPETLRFWKTRIEETDADKTFRVGVLYGPSGCGKSSLVKAGLLPRLADHVRIVYVEATSQGMELRLLNGLRKACPGLSQDLSLKDVLGALRRGEFLGREKKILMVLDQFEQWLHGKGESLELVQALRQCDGGRVQCIVTVRDDFWMALSRFMRDLEVPIEGQNSAAVDLFDQRHARKVLSAFGQAYSTLPENGELSQDQMEFITQAIAGLSQEGKIIPVRLALFAEMVKSKPWTMTTLNEVGGTEGIGVAFLEETFAASTAPPQHRLHSKAAQAVLKSLLPEAGTDIKGHMRAQRELLEISAYSSRPKDFDELLRILDGELRLITPTDPPGADTEDNNVPVTGGGQYYQLTHDYLVHSLRDWLARKQKETRRGRTELLLADRAGVWNARPENRQLPSLLQWLQIRCFCRRKNWTAAQRKMMHRATRYHAVQGLALVLFLTFLGWGSYEIFGNIEAHALRDRLLDASTSEVPAIVKDMAFYRRWLDPLLQGTFQEIEKKEEPRKKLHTSLALLPVDATQVEYLFGRLLDAQPYEVPVIRDALFPYQEELKDKLWATAEKPDKGKERQRLRAAAVLARYDPDGGQWIKIADSVANDMVAVPAVYLATWMDLLRPVRSQLLEPLVVIFRDRENIRPDMEQSLATHILADYAADHLQVLVDMVMDADEGQFAVLYPKLEEHGERGLSILENEVNKEMPIVGPPDVKEELAKRQANAAAALLKMGRSAHVWPLLKSRPDSRVRSYLIHRFSPLEVASRTISKQLEEETDVTVCRALILGLGEFNDKQLPPEERKNVVSRLQDLYRTAADPGLHGAAEWLLRSWKQESWLNRVKGDLVKDREERTKRELGIKKLLSQPGHEPRVAPQWYIDSQGHTMVVVPGPVEFMMGSPAREQGRLQHEELHRQRIGRTFAIASSPVTIQQYLPFHRFQFHTEHKYLQERAPAEDCPVHYTTWNMAAAYCNWVSDQEGIPKEQWCYETNAQGQVTRMKENYLKLTGYRLPTEAEWEYACRAGSMTSWYFGDADNLLAKYGWYLLNAKERSWPVGSLKPNDLGLFDMHGNLWCWCQECYGPYPQDQDQRTRDDSNNDLIVDIEKNRVLRGGAYDTQGSTTRSASRWCYTPSTHSWSVGFRVARTFLP